MSTAVIVEPAAASAATATAAPADTKKLGVFAMTLLVISGNVRRRRLQHPAEHGAVGGALAPSSCLGRVGARHLLPRQRTFQVLVYAPFGHDVGHLHDSRAGFGKLVGFLIAWGYWPSPFGNVGSPGEVLLMERRPNFFFPALFQGRQHLAGDPS